MFVAFILKNIIGYQYFDALRLSGVWIGPPKRHKATGGRPSLCTAAARVTPPDANPCTGRFLSIFILFSYFFPYRHNVFWNVRF